jgi:hypothetical protein
MRDKKDNATFDLPGLEEAIALPPCAVEPKKLGPRARRATLQQEQLPLIDETDATGLPVWRRDEGLDLTGLPVWAPSANP